MKQKQFKQTIILIGGAPATGKSTIAKMISRDLSVPWISTDFIRGWMKKISNKNDFPHLFHFTNTTAEQHYKKYTLKEIFDDGRKRDKTVFKGFLEFIRKNDSHEMWDSFIVEGISILPELVKKLETINCNIIPIFLIDEDEQRIREIVYKRGLWDDANTYADWVKEKEIIYLKKVNDYYLKGCRKHNLRYFIIDKNREKTIKEINKHIKQTTNNINKLSLNKLRY